MSTGCACLRSTVVSSERPPITRGRLIEHMRDNLCFDQEVASEALCSARCWLTDQLVGRNKIFVVAVPGEGCQLVNESGCVRAMAEFNATVVDSIDHSPCKGALNRLLRRLVGSLYEEE
jgi:hypothetical protein